MKEYAPLILFLVLGPVIAGSAILAGKLLGFQSPDSDRKRSAYECGVEPFGNARIQFKAGYYLFALLFLVFDIEALFLFPCLKILRGVVTGQAANVPSGLIFIELGIFIVILFIGWAYAWRKGALEWE